MICLKLGSWLASQKADKNVQLHSRSPHGERGLKFRRQRARIRAQGRSPHGERGLKSRRRSVEGVVAESLSSRRAWIEMQKHGLWESGHRVALLTESVD